MLNVTTWPAWWGLLGATIYAIPKLTTCLYADAGQPHLRKCISEALTALLTGTVAAAIFSAWIQNYLHATSMADERAIAGLMGMLANTTAPAIIKFLGDTVMNRIKGGH